MEKIEAVYLIFMNWTKTNSGWELGEYLIKKRFRYFQLYRNGILIENFNTLNDAKNSIS